MNRVRRIPRPRAEKARREPFPDARIFGCAQTRFPWYYVDANDKAPAWTGVVYLYNYLTRTRPAVGPAAYEAPLSALLPGDIVQLSFDGTRWAHSPVVVSVGEPRSYENVLVAAHSYDADDRPLSTYEFVLARFLHVFGVYKP